MKIVTQNPYRIAGVLSNSSAREIEKQKSRIARFASVGKDVESDYDFPFLGAIERSAESAQEAFAKIEQNSAKLDHSIFWFVNNGPIDETALDHLKNGDPDKAIEIWTKTTENKDVSAANYSYFNNLGTLLIAKGEKEATKTALRLKFELLNSPQFKDFVGLVADDNFTIEKTKQIDLTIKKLIGEFSSYSTFNGADLINLFDTCPASVKDQVAKNFTEDPLHTIENRIENAKNTRKAEPEESYNCGKTLYDSTQKELENLRSVLSAEATDFKLISDKLAKEILQCGIDYFKAKNQGVTAAGQAVELAEYAKKIAVSVQVLDRINENLEAIKEWSAGAPSEEEMSKVETEYNAITKALDAAMGKTGNMQHAVTLYQQCKPHLVTMKEKLGNTNELYLSLTSALTQICLNIIVDVVNLEQSKLGRDHNRLNQLSTVVDRAVQIMNSLIKWDMKPEARQRLKENKVIIERTKSQIRTAKSNKSGADAVNVIRLIGGLIVLGLLAARGCA